MLRSDSPRAATTNPDSNPEELLLVKVEREGLQLGRGANLFQFASLVVFAAIGAITGWFLTEDRPDIGSLVGSVLGMIAGTFLSGFALLLMPLPKTAISRRELQARQAKLNRRLIAATIALALSMVGLPLVLWRFGRDDSDLAWCICLFSLCLCAGLCAYTKGLALRISERNAQLSARDAVQRRG